MKKIIPFILAAIILLLCSFSASNAGSTKLTVAVPKEHTVTVVCAKEGCFRVDDKSYVDTKVFKVNRFSSFTVQALPVKSYVAEFKSEKGIGTVDVTAESFTVRKVNRNLVINIGFLTKSSAKNQYITGLPDDCVMSAGTNKWFSINVKQGVNLTYLWEYSSDGGITWKSAVGDNTKQKYYLVLVQENEFDKDVPYQYRVTVTDEQGISESDTIRVMVTNDYLYKKLIQENDGLALTSFIHNNTELVVTRLDSTNDEAVAMARTLTEDQVPLFVYDVSLINSKGEVVPYVGELELEFYVGEAYNGTTLRVFHQHDDGMKIHTGEVENGILKIKVDDLSTFMIEAPRDSVYNIYAISNLYGKVSPAGKLFVGKGENIKFEFDPDFGYIVDSVLVNGRLVEFDGNSYTLSKVDSNQTISVNFRKCTSCMIIWLILLALIFAMLVMLIIWKNRRTVMNNQSVSPNFENKPDSEQTKQNL